MTYNVSPELLGVTVTDKKLTVVQRKKMQTLHMKEQQRPFSIGFDS